MKLKCLVLSFLSILVGCQYKNVYYQLNSSFTIIDDNKDIDLQRSYFEVVESVVTIYAFDQLDNGGMGTGFVYKNDAKYTYIATNAHVVESASSFYVFFDEVHRYKAQKIGHSSNADVAALRIPLQDLDFLPTPLEMADSDHLNPGEQVFAIGSPLTKTLYSTVTHGYISGLNRVLEIPPYNPDIQIPLIQSDVAINQGNSGGPLFNALGKVIGVNSYKITGYSGNPNYRLSFSININYFLRILASIEKNSKGMINTLGLVVNDINYLPLEERKGLDKGLIVEDFDRLALNINKSKIEIGDIITKIDNQEIDQLSTYQNIIMKQFKNQVEVELVRKNQIKNVTLYIYQEDF